MVAPVSWRDGVHLTGTPIWCDARRRRDVCFVSSADRVGAAGHGQLIGSAVTLALVAASGSGHLAVPMHRPFTLGTLRLELIPSGRCLGSAALHVDAGGRTVLYAGAVRTTDVAEPADVRASDAVVVAAPLGEPSHRLRPRDEIAGQLVAWIRARLAVGKPPVLVVDSALDGLEIAARLVAEGIAVSASRSVRDAARRIVGFAGTRGEAESITLTSLAAGFSIRAPGRAPSAVIRAAGDALKLTRASSSVALVSARALAPQPGFEAGFAWPFVAGRDQLLAWIEQTRAREVFVTGACAEAIAAVLGDRARVLGPPRQMTLFPREAAS